MKQWIKWLKAIRPKTVGMAVILLPVSASIANVKFDQSMWLIMAFVALAGAGTMLVNDYIDREHDRKKNKSLAYENPEKFLTVTIIFWFSAILLVAALMIINFGYGLVALGLVVVGLSYSLFLKVPFWPMLHVGFASAGSVYFIMVNGLTYQMMFLSFLVILYITGREILKDLEDIEIDKIHKWTLPVKYGERTSRYVVFFIYMAVAALLFGLIQGLPSYIYAVPVLMILLSTVIVLGAHHKLSKLSGDLTLSIMMVVFLFQ